MTRRRRMVAGAIVIAWLAAIALLARRELFRPAAERLARAALMVAPGDAYYVVSQRGRQIGFATSNIDTTAAGLELSDIFMADFTAERVTQRATAKVLVQLSRALKLRGFRFELGGAIGPLTATGTVIADSILLVVVAPKGEKADTQRVRIAPGTLLPTAVPLALVLAYSPEVGKTVHFSVFDPMAMAAVDLAVHVRAETTFVLDDSASFDRARGRWVAARHETVHAWRIEPEGSGMLGPGWVDDRGRIVETMQFGDLALHRTAQELAYLNWTIDRARVPVVASADDDIQETTAIAASAPIGDKRALTRLRVRLRGVPLAGYELDGGRQALHGDTLDVRREANVELGSGYTLPADARRFGADLKPEPLVQSDDPEIRAMAARIVGAERDPARAAALLARWVNTSLRKEVVFTLPNAAQTLRTRRGDCNEHTALYIALARAVGLPARSASGLTYVSGKFYYHAWPEVFLGTWVAVDPTFGQFPADAAHLRFVNGGYIRQGELLRLVGKLQIDVLATDPPLPPSAP